MTEAYEREPMSLATGQAHTVKLPPRVMRGRLTGFLFESGRTFLLPSALRGIKALANFYAAHPGLRVLVTGHTDTQGPPHYNRGLSDERAAAVAAYLVDDVATWLARYQGGGFGTAWGVREDQHMLTALPDGAPPYYAGKVHGQLDAATQDAVRRFQADHGLPVNGVPGPPTRRALVTDYMAIDGTSLPAGTEIQQHGCGEHHPAVPTPDETDEALNRRVEVFFFEGPIEPPPRRPCPSPGCAEYPEWLRRTILTIDHDLGDELHAAEVLVVDPAGEPVAGADVLLQSAQAHQGQSGADGVAHFSDLWAGRYAITATHPKYLAGQDELIAAPGGSNKAKVPLTPRLLKITYRHMFSIDNQESVRMLGDAVGAGMTVTIGALSATTDATGTATFDAAALGPGVHRAVASAASVDKQYTGVTGPLVLPRPAPKDDKLYRDLDIEFFLDGTSSVSGASGGPGAPSMKSPQTDGGVWRKGPLEILVDWKPVWIRAKFHAPRTGHPNDNPNVVVVHRTAGPSMGSAIDLIGGGTRSISVHYVVDVDGYVLKLVREDEVANHAGDSFWAGQVGVNATSVGIECVSADNQDYPQRQMDALHDLIWRIRGASNIPLRNVVGHGDVDVIRSRAPVDLSCGTERPHDPGIELDWPFLADRLGAGPLARPAALAADPATVTQAQRDTMYGGYFRFFSEPWGNGDSDARRVWGGKRRPVDPDPQKFTGSGLIAELQRDLKTIGYSIASSVAQQPNGEFTGALGRTCVRVKHRWFAGPSNKARWSTFKDKPTLDRDTAIMIKAVLNALP